MKILIYYNHTDTKAVQFSHIDKNEDILLLEYMQNSFTNNLQAFYF